MNLNYNQKFYLSSNFLLFDRQFSTAVVLKSPRFFTIAGFFYVFFYSRFSGIDTNFDTNANVSDWKDWCQLGQVDIFNALLGTANSDEIYPKRSAIIAI